jgi:hydroxymethylpyrimidine/phosphomethylpyrimidine kinase
MAGLYNEAEMVAVIENVREAVAVVETNPGMRELVAECQMNIGMALSYAVSPMDVAAVDGRLTRHMDGVRAAGCPRFGASRHIANTILAVREFDKRKRAALNLRYSEEIVEACKEAGLTVSYYDRREEPEEIKRIEGMTTRWGAGEAVKRAGKTPDVIYHLGDWGKEPMVVLVGETATQVAGWALRVMDMLGGG